jgi:hypothetical protein
MGQDSLNLQYGKRHPAKQRPGDSVDMHNDEGQFGSGMVPGYGQARISKTKIIGKKDKPKGMPKVAGAGYKSAREEFMTPQAKLKRRK